MEVTGKEQQQQHKGLSTSPLSSDEGLMLAEIYEYELNMDLDSDSDRKQRKKPVRLTSQS
jgi:hypothetical protein